MQVKERLLEACRNILIDKKDHLFEAMDEAQKSANDYGPPKDRYDSFRTQLLRKRDMFAQQLAVANEQLKTLDKIDLQPVAKIGFGSLVVTDSQRIFIAIGLGKIKLDQEVYFAVSPVVPIARELEGKEKGQSFSINGKTAKILEVW